MIVSFGDPATEDLYHGRNTSRVRRFPANIVAAALRKLDVIRAANILNKVYFSEVQLKQILSNIAIQLKPSGLLLVSKTDDMGINHATIFRKTKNGFSLLSKLNSGSEITDLALQLFF